MSEHITAWTKSSIFCSQFGSPAWKIAIFIQISTRFVPKAQLTSHYHNKLYDEMYPSLSLCKLFVTNDVQWPFLLTWINFNPYMDK